MIKEADQDRWLTLATTQIPVQLIAELSRRAGTTPARSIRLDVLVEQLHRVELGAVAGRKCSSIRSAWRPTQALTSLARCTGWPSTIRWTFRPPQSRSSRPRKSMKTRLLNDPVKR